MLSSASLELQKKPPTRQHSRRIRPETWRLSSQEARSGEAGLRAQYESFRPPSFCPSFLPGHCPWWARLANPRGQAAQRSYKTQREAATAQGQGQKLNQGGAWGIDFNPISQLDQIEEGASHPHPPEPFRVKLNGLGRFVNWKEEKNPPNTNGKQRLLKTG